MADVTKDEREFLMNRMITRAIAIVVTILFLSVTTCTVHMNSYNPDEARAEAATAAVGIQVSQQKHTEEMARLKMVEELIATHKVDPIAARCAVEGWTLTTKEVCLELVKPKPEQMPEPAAEEVTP
mgnify:CR=1 FL=1